MEKFSNEYADLHKELKVELSSLELNEGEQYIVKYSEIPWFPHGQFAIFLVENKFTHHYKLIEKTWDSEYDRERFSTGVFNLDRLCIRTRDIQIPFDKQKECQDLIQSLSFIPETLESQGYIILDGIEYELAINTNSISKKYKWKKATDDIKYFESLISFMKTLVEQ